MQRLQPRLAIDAIAADASTQVIVLRGAVALSDARAIQAQVIEGIFAGRTRVVLDLTGVSGTGSGLLGVLLRIRRGVTRVDGRLALVVEGPPVSDLVATSLLARLIDVTSRRADALALVRGQHRGGAAVAHKGFRPRSS
jgi:anti-anti-sigma factor